ncbi:MAG TPA: thioredoxin-like domain-containing protein [Caulifigura sp.]|nr:thioredoxin-like domain-containing protein [Caulifigura sp.]
MLRRIAPITLLLAAIATTGCTRTEDKPAAPTSPPVVESGPAPAGQTEPGAEETKPAEPATPPAGESKPAAPPQSLLPNPADLHPVAFYADEPVKVEITDWTGVEKWVASQKGKVVVMDMWSLSCEPCRKEFPNLVKLHNDHHGKVACLSVSTDYAGIKSKPPAFYEPKVLEFLASQKATCKNILCSVESDAIFEKLDLASIPAVYVYGKDGKLAKRFTGEEVHYDKEVLPLVVELLKK